VDGKITLGLVWLPALILRILQFLIGNLKYCEWSRNLCLEGWVCGKYRNSEEAGPAARFGLLCNTAEGCRMLAKELVLCIMQALLYPHTSLTSRAFIRGGDTVL